MSDRLDRLVRTITRQEFINWAREVSRIVIDQGDNESLQLFRNMPIRNAVFLYLNYDTANNTADVLMDRNYLDIDNSGRIVGVYSENGEDYYPLLGNLNLVGLSGSYDEDIDRIVENQNVAEVYLDADIAFDRYEGEEFIRDIPTMQGFSQVLEGYPYEAEIDYWRYRS